MLFLLDRAVVIRRVSSEGALYGKSVGLGRWGCRWEGRRGYRWEGRRGCRERLTDCGGRDNRGSNHFVCVCVTKNQHVENSVSMTPF